LPRSIDTGVILAVVAAAVATIPQGLAMVVTIAMAVSEALPFS